MRHKILQTLAFSLLMAVFCITTLPRQASAFYFQEAETEEAVKEEAKKIEGRANREVKERGRKAGSEAEREARRNGEKAKNAGERVAREGQEAGERVRREGREAGERVEREGQEAGERVRREGQEAGERVRKEGREAGERAERRDSTMKENGRKATEEERAARREEMGERVNPRSIRGSDMTPEQLQSQIADAKIKEMERHEARLARIEEIRGHASTEGNSDVMERVNALISKENKMHEKKLGKLAEMEKRFAQKMEKKMKGSN
ncbi:MAG: hypothetical protein AB8G77_04525 [Rhodothermales bacterium]